MPEVPGRKPLRFHELHFVRSEGRKNERGTEKERYLFGGRDIREPERSESPGEHEAPTRSNSSGCCEERRFLRGIKPLRRRFKAGRF
jgi:hypothetical protein